jgi:HlyD family secretion protein
MNRLRILVVALLASSLYSGYRIYVWRQPYEWSGTIEARTISIGSRAGGRVKEVLVHEGEHLKEGQPVVVLEPGDLEAQHLAAKGQLMQAQANLEKLQRGARPEEIQQAQARSSTASAALEQTRSGARQEQIAAAQARLEAAQVAVEKAQLDHERMQKLFDSGAASRADHDNSTIALKSAIALRDATQGQFQELKNGSRREEVAQAAARALEARASAKLIQAGSRVEDIKAARGMVDAAQGRLDQMAVMLNELTIRAPRAARVESFDLRPGDILAPNATAATLLEDDQLYLRIYIPETQLGHIRVGQEVNVAVDSFPHRTFRGVVEHISHVGEYSPRNLQTADERADQVFATRVGLREGREELRAGMAAFIKVPK